MAKKKNKPVEQNVDVDVCVPEVVEPAVVEEPVQKDIRTGVVTGCMLLNVRAKPSLDSDVISTINKDTTIEIDEEGSTNDFYKVKLDTGVVGFCVKRFVGTL